MDIVYTSPHCPHKTFTFHGRFKDTPHKRLRPFLQLILGFDPVSEKILQGIWASPRQLSGPISYEEHIRFQAGCDEEKRYEWILSLSFVDLFHIYHFLQSLAIWDPEKTIPVPPTQ